MGNSLNFNASIYTEITVNEGIGVLFSDHLLFSLSCKRDKYLHTQFSHIRQRVISLISYPIPYTTSNHTQFQIIQLFLLRDPKQQSVMMHMKIIPLMSYPQMALQYFLFFLYRISYSFFNSYTAKYLAKSLLRLHCSVQPA